MKKSILILLIICLTVFIGLKINWDITSAKNERTEVVVWTLQMASFSDYINGIIKEYETQNPNIKIKWIDVPFSEGEKRTLASILSNNPPDLVNLNPDFSAILAQKGALELIPENKLSEFNEDVVKSLKYQGNLYAIPWYATSAVTIYNKKLFNNSGVKTFPKTFNDIANISEQIKNRTGAYAYFPTITENDTMLKILNKYGVTTENIDSDESVKVFDMYKKLYQNKLIPAESITQTHQEALEKYMSENVVFYQGGANFLSMIKDNAPNVYQNTEVAPQIVGKLGQNDFSLMNFIIPVRAKHKKEALDFCLFLTNQKNQLELAKMTNVISTNKYALKDKFYNSDNDVMARARMYSARQIGHINPVVHQQNNQKDINLLINTGVQSVLLNKDNTISVLKQIKRDISKLK